MHRLQFNNKLVDDPEVTLFIHPFVPSYTFYCNIITISSPFVDLSKTTFANLIIEIIATFFQLFEGNIGKKQISILYMNSWRVSLFQYASTRISTHWSTKSRFWSVVQAGIATFDCFYSFFLITSGMNIVFEVADLGHGLFFQNLAFYGWVSHNTHIIYVKIYCQNVVPRENLPLFCLVFLSPPKTLR